MKRNQKKNRRLCAVLGALLLLSLALGMLTGCTAKTDEAITSAEQLRQPGRKIGTGLATTAEEQLPEDFPDAEIIPYIDCTLGYADVAGGRIDAFVYDRRPMELAIENGTKGVRLLEENYTETVIAAAVSPVTPIPELKEKLNEFIAQCKSDGTLQDMYDRWVVLGDRTMPEISLPETSQIHLRVATAGTLEPYTYFVGTELRGYDIELAYRFAAYLGATLEFGVYDFGGLLAAAKSGEMDCVMSNLYYSPEHAEAVIFSDPLFSIQNTFMVRDPDAAAAAAEPSPRQVSLSDYNGKKLGVLVGPLMEDAAAQFFPDSPVLLLDTYPDCVAALLTGKIDAFLGDEPGMKSLHAEQPEIDYIHERLTENNYSFAFRKDDPDSAALCAELNDFLARCRADGTLQQLEEIWLGVDESRKTVDMSGLTGENGTVRVVTTATDMPWSYIKDGKNVGYDIDLVVRFCRDRGYALELGDVDFAGRIPAVQSGKYDFTTDMNVTPERMEQVLFSDPTSQGGIVLAVRAADLTAASEPASGGGEKRSLDELAGKRIGVITGTIHDSLVAERLPTAKIEYFSQFSEMLAALQAGKLDAFVQPLSGATFMRYENPDITWLDEHLLDGKLGFVFPKTEQGKALNERFSEFIRRLRNDGTMQALVEKWFGPDESAKNMPDYTALPAVNGTLRLATAANLVPFVYIRDNVPVGFELEIAALFCEENGLALEVEQMNFDGILPAVQSGKCDMAANCLVRTEERAEKVDFSEPHYSESVVFVVMNTAAAGAKTSFFDGVLESFEKTFLRESRWKLFVQGIGTTLLITVLSVLFGTMLGFGVFLLCRKGNRVANAITRVFVWLIQGLPVVVLLMVLYYIIFGSVAISGTVVSIIGFTLIFGAAVYGMLRTGVTAVDRGQTEAAYTLGYSDRHAFFRIVLPQALPLVLPSYKGEITGLIKATAIVGYVAVQDLTKMGDIVRSRTYEAFFPLIAVAIIYFILAGILIFIVNRIEPRIDPRRRSPEQILRDVQSR